MQESSDKSRCTSDRPGTCPTLADHEVQGKDWTLFHPTGHLTLSFH